MAQCRLKEAELPVKFGSLEGSGFYYRNCMVAKGFTYRPVVYPVRISDQSPEALLDYSCVDNPNNWICEGYAFNYVLPWLSWLPASPPAADLFSALPSGTRQIGTYSGRPMYQTPDGRRWMWCVNPADSGCQPNYKYKRAS
jgi:hypothetical protein